MTVDQELVDGGAPFFCSASCQKVREFCFFFSFDADEKTTTAARSFLNLGLDLIFFFLLLLPLSRKNENPPQIHAGLRAMTGSRVALNGSLSLQIAIAPKTNQKGGSNDCDGGGGGGGRANSSTLDAAVRILRGAFAPLRTDDGVDLVTAVCRGMSSSSSAPGDGEDGGEGGKKKDGKRKKKKEKKERKKKNDGDGSDDDESDDGGGGSSSTLSDYDFEGFAVALLRKGATPVAAAAFRPRGAAFAELPYLATSASHRRRGLARRLLAALEALLGSPGVGVRNVVVPAALPLATAVWEHAFGYSRVSLAERAALSTPAGRVFELAEQSATVVKKCLVPEWNKAKRAAERSSARAAAAAVSRSASAGGAASCRSRSRMAESCDRPKHERGVHA